MFALPTLPLPIRQPSAILMTVFDRETAFRDTVKDGWNVAEDAETIDFIDFL
jgi:hypothetical protein